MDIKQQFLRLFKSDLHKYVEDYYGEQIFCKSRKQKKVIVRQCIVHFLDSHADLYRKQKKQFIQKLIDNGTKYKEAIIQAKTMEFYKMAWTLNDIAYLISSSENGYNPTHSDIIHSKRVISNLNNGRHEDIEIILSEITTIIGSAITAENRKMNKIRKLFNYIETHLILPEELKATFERYKTFTYQNINLL